MLRIGLNLFAQDRRFLGLNTYWDRTLSLNKYSGSRGWHLSVLSRGAFIGRSALFGTVFVLDAVRSLCKRKLPSGGSRFDQIEHAFLAPWGY
jgi:hypothetical protein